jgi:hypothetical protein
MKFYPNIGKIVIYYDNTVTAVLYKNSINTELKFMMEDMDSGSDGNSVCSGRESDSDCD